MTYNLRNRKVTSEPVKQAHKQDPYCIYCYKRGHDVPSCPRLIDNEAAQQDIRAYMRTKLMFQLLIKPKIEEYNSQTLSEYLGLPLYFIDHEKYIVSQCNTKLRPTETIAKIKYFDSFTFEPDQNHKLFCDIAEKLIDTVNSQEPGKLIAFIAVMHLCFDTLYGKKRLEVQERFRRSMICGLANIIHDTKDSSCPMRQFVREKAIGWMIDVCRYYQK